MNRVLILSACLFHLVALFGIASPCRGHTSVSMDPFESDGCMAGLDNLQDSWAVSGVLAVRNHVGTVCFDAEPGNRIRVVVVIPPKAAYEGDNDVTMALVGPGLPTPDRPVPLGLAAGKGAVFAGVDSALEPYPKRNYLGWWHGVRLDVEIPATGRYEVRAFSPSDWRGEYYLVFTGEDPTRPSSVLENTPLPLPGDITHDEQLTVMDAIQALIITLSVKSLQDPAILAAGDVAPPGDPNRFIAAGNGVIDLGDVVRILRRIAGLDDSIYWPDE